MNYFNALFMCFLAIYFLCRDENAYGIFVLCFALVFIELGKLRLEKDKKKE